jgi:macrodomain Ter protein organizer (MatP/YcbG family)
MAVDEATKKQDALELYQINDKAIVPSFKSHRDELRKFLQEHNNENLSLLVKLKQFIRTYRLPFNMQRYMEVQRTYIQQSLQTQMQNRQEAVSHWIQEHACRHRNRMIQLQCLYLERVKDKLIPEVQAMLEHRLEKLQGNTKLDSDGNQDNAGK